MVTAACSHLGVGQGGNGPLDGHSAGNALKRSTTGSSSLWSRAKIRSTADPGCRQPEWL